jgi:hypothetical protein
MKLKLLFWLLLVGNVVLFGMSRGYFGANASERREPQRLAEQLRPELLSVLPANSEKLASQLRAQPRRRRRPLPTATAAAAPTAAAPAATPPRRPRPSLRLRKSPRSPLPVLRSATSLPPMRAAFGPAGQPQAG